MNLDFEFVVADRAVLLEFPVANPGRLVVLNYSKRERGMVLEDDCYPQVLALRNILLSVIMVFSFQQLHLCGQHLRKIVLGQWVFELELDDSIIVYGRFDIVVIYFHF